MSLDLTNATFTVDGMKTERGRPDDQCRLYVTVECAPGAAATTVREWDKALGRALTTPASVVVSEYAANLSAVRADLACARMALESARGEVLSAKEESRALVERVATLESSSDGHARRGLNDVASALGAERGAGESVLDCVQRILSDVKTARIFRARVSAEAHEIMNKAAALRIQG